MKDKTMQLICIEGNIGAGKSTLTEQLAKEMGARAMFEPVDENPYLADFYGDPARYALEMQFWLMSRRFKMHKQACNHIWETGQSVIMDRSIYGDWVFAKKNWQDGNISDVGYQSYLHHRHVMNSSLLVPHVMLFLEVHPELCQSRIATRGRKCERSVPLPYLEGLNVLHRELMLEMKQKGSTVIPFDWNIYREPEKVAMAIRGER